MSRPRMGETFICPNCHKPVDPAKLNAMMSAITKQWQHKDCWTPRLASSHRAGDHPHGSEGLAT